jgi:hypothetical protein
MPSTVPGLIVFVLFLTPGACYALRRAATGPTVSDPSAIRETAGLVAVSVASNGITLLVFALVYRLVAWPIDPAEALVDGDGLARSRTLFLASWAAAFLALSCLVAVGFSAAGGSGWYRRLKSSRHASWLLGTPVDRGSAWWRTFLDPDVDWSTRAAYLGCELTDGSWLGGYIETFSPDSDEDTDRDLVLVEPISFRAAGVDEPVELDVTRVIIGAAQLRFMTVAYVPRPGSEAATVA